MSNQDNFEIVVFADTSVSSWYVDLLSNDYGFRFLSSKNFNLDTSVPEAKSSLIIVDILLGECSTHWIHLYKSVASLAKPVIFITDAEDFDLFQHCHQLGATDCFIRPLNNTHLLHKIRLILDQRYLRKKETVLRGDLNIDLLHGILSDGKGQFVELTKNETKIFKALYEAPMKTLQREQLYLAFSKGAGFNFNTLNVHICNLRKKLCKLALEVEFCAPGSYVLQSDKRKSMKSLNTPFFESNVNEACINLQDAN